MALSERSRDGTRQRPAKAGSIAQRGCILFARPTAAPAGGTRAASLRPGFESRSGGGTQRIAVLADCFCFALGIAASLAGAAQSAQMGIGSSYAVGTITKSEAAGACLDAAAFYGLEIEGVIDGVALDFYIIQSF